MVDEIFVPILKVKKSISFIRGNLTDGIWKLTYSQAVLFEQNWTLAVQSKLQAFETDILNSMRIRGWDGNEDTEKLQWTFMGALFYSIIVITTIGEWFTCLSCISFFYSV